MSLTSASTMIDRAREQTGLKDFGESWLLENLDTLVPIINAEARLNAEGEAGAEAQIVGALSARLRHIELVKNHPEILDEKVNVAAVIVGLPRTGSTLLHRMLSSAPHTTAVRWYEAQNYVPFPDEQRGEPKPRIEAAQQILDYMLLKIPELMSIHPMSIDQPDEEVIIMGQWFSSTMVEASYFVPSYAEWLTAQPSAPVYQDLYQVLQSLQWQDPSRQGKRWILKTPGHLMALDALLQRFPGAKIVMTHRDPVQTVPSYCSMQRSLYAMGSDDITNAMIGDYWPGRLNELMQRFMQVRDEGNNEQHFIDVQYRDLLADPVAEGEKILKRAGIDPETALPTMRQWVEDNRRGERAAHDYSAEEFGLTAAGIRELFSDYHDRYLTRR